MPPRLAGSTDRPRHLSLLEVKRTALTQYGHKNSEQLLLYPLTYANTNSQCQYHPNDCGGARATSGMNQIASHRALSNVVSRRIQVANDVVV